MSLSVNGAVQIWWIAYVKLWNRRERFMLGLKLDLGHQWDRRSVHNISEVSLFQGLSCMQELFFGERQGVLIREVSLFHEELFLGKEKCPYSSFQGVSERLVLN